MKKPLIRELLWISLPSLLIVGAVLWKSGGQARWQQATRPRVEVADIYFYRSGPLAGQNSWDDLDFGFVTPIKLNDPLRLTQGKSFGFDWKKLQFYGQDGKPLKPQPNVSAHMPPQYLFNKEIDPSGDMMRGLSCDLDRVPLSIGEIILRSQWLLPNGRPQPFSVVVRPDWFSCAPRTLRLESVRWLKGEKCGVEIIVRASGKTANLLADDQLEGSGVGWKQGVSKSEDNSIYQLRPRLLYNWSPRFQSNDGRYDSYEARDAYVWAALKSHLRTSLPQSFNARPFLDTFKPSIICELPKHYGNTFKIIYQFNGLESEPRAQQFVTDIGVPGDGFLQVKIPVPLRKSK